MNSCGHGPGWRMQHPSMAEICELPQPPHCVKHMLPLGLCDECGSTVRLGVWAQGLNSGELVTALGGLTGGSFYRGPERDALIREAIRRLPA